MTNQKPPRRGENLTDREQQVCDLLTQGFSQKEVGRKLSISHRTVQVYLHRAYRKLGINNVVLLTRAVLGVPNAR
jgi:two-component system nitrate/nitrite response regulator NarL